VLRVDELRKLGGTPCVHQRAGGGCGIHPQRPGICRAYRCLWLGGGLRDDDRPDALGAVLDVVSRGASVWLEIREAQPGAFERSARLREIAHEYRASMPVRIGDSADVLDPERRFRVLLPNGEGRVDDAGAARSARHPPAPALARALAAAPLARRPPSPRRELPRRALGGRDDAAPTSRRDRDPAVHRRGVSSADPPSRSRSRSRASRWARSGSRCSSPRCGDSRTKAKARSRRGTRRASSCCAAPIAMFAIR
jgi:hypothetical protein